MELREQIAKIIEQVYLSEHSYGYEDGSIITFSLDKADAILALLAQQAPEALKLLLRERLYNLKFKSGTIRVIKDNVPDYRLRISHCDEIVDQLFEIVIPIMAAKEEQARREERERIVRILVNRTANIFGDGHIRIALTKEDWNTLKSGKEATNG